MKIQFDTTETWQDHSAISVADLATAQYFVLLDTVNPPVKSYQVPAAVILKGTANADGSKHVTLTEADLGVTLAPNTTYYVDMADSVKGVASDPTAVITYVNVVKPSSPANFTVA